MPKNNDIFTLCIWYYVTSVCTHTAQVNADIKKYRLENGVPRLFEVDETTVGKYLSTKAVGSYQREDLTSEVRWLDALSSMINTSLLIVYED